MVNRKSRHERFGTMLVGLLPFAALQGNLS